MTTTNFKTYAAERSTTLDEAVLSSHPLTRNQIRLALVKVAKLDYGKATEIARKIQASDMESVQKFATFMRAQNLQLEQTMALVKYLSKVTEEVLFIESEE